MLVGWFQRICIAQHSNCGGVAAWYIEHTSSPLHNITIKSEILSYHWSAVISRFVVVSFNSLHMGVTRDTLHWPHVKAEPVPRVGRHLTDFQPPATRHSRPSNIKSATYVIEQELLI